MRAAVFGNVGTMVTFRVGAYDAEVLEKEFAPVFTAEDLVNLGSYQIYLKLMIDGIGSKPFSASTLPPIEKPEVSSVEEIIRHSRRVYAEPKAEVEKKILDWHEEGKVVMPKPAPKGEKRNDFKRDNRMEERRDDRPREEKRDFKPKQEFVRPDPVVQRPAPEQFQRPVTPPVLVSQDDFKPLKSITLDTLKQKSNNQRPVSEKNVNDLRNALSSIIKTPNKVETPQPKQESKIEVKVEPKVDLQPVEPKKPKEIPEAELKALLDVE